MSQSSNDKHIPEQENFPGLSPAEADKPKPDTQPQSATNGSTAGAGEPATGDALLPGSDGNRCPQCGAQRIARSRTRGLDILRVRLLPQRPFRCLRCYHRFWRTESFLADKRRLWSWLGVILLLLLFALWQRVPQPDSVHRVESNRSVSGQLNMSTDAELPEDGNQAAAAVGAESQAERELRLMRRQLVEDAGFGGPAEDLVAEADESANVTTDSTAPEPEPVVAQVPDSLTAAAEAAQAAAAGVAGPVADIEATAAGTEDVGQVAEQQIERTLEIDPVEQESLLKVELAYYVEQWRKAWEAGDSGAYLAYYADEFQPADGLSAEAWRQQRRSRVLPEREISVRLSDFSVLFSEDKQTGTVSFNQQYKARRYADSSRKRLVWTRDGQQWKIISELELR